MSESGAPPPASSPSAGDGRTSPKTGKVLEEVLAEQDKVTKGAGDELSKQMARRRALSATASAMPPTPTRKALEEAKGTAGGAKKPPLSPKPEGESTHLP